MAEVLLRERHLKYISRACIPINGQYNNIFVSVPECKAKKTSPPPEEISVNSVCSVNDLNVCGRNQVCVQAEEGGESGQGLCECLTGFATQDDGVSSEVVDSVRC